MKVKDVMTRRIVSVAPEESAAVAARLLARYNVGALPVCTAEGRLKGVVTDRDIVLRCVAAEEEPSRTKISEIMTRRVVSVDAGEQAEAAAQIMAREQIRRLPVEENGKLVGMVSLGDLAVVPDFPQRLQAHCARSPRTRSGCDFPAASDCGNTACCAGDALALPAHILCNSGKICTST